jgi:hypothetical protein
MHYAMACSQTFAHRGGLSAVGIDLLFYGLADQHLAGRLLLHCKKRSGHGVGARYHIKASGTPLHPMKSRSLA